MWWHRFVNRTDAYAKQVVINEHCQYFVEYQPITPALFEAHLSGAITLGLPAIDQSGFCRWCCFDSDSDDGNLDRIEQLLIKHHWHCVREGKRPGRAGHLWMFFQSPALASDLRLFGHRIIVLAGVPRASIEFFPKSDKAEYDEEKQRVKVCSVVRLPLGVHRKPDAGGIRGWFTGVDQDIAKQIAWIESQPQNPVVPIIQAAPRLRQLAAATRPAPASQFVPVRSVDPDQVRRALAQIPQTPGVHYDVWLKVGMALKASGLPLELWEEWSARSPKHQPGACARRWETFRPDGRIGLGTIFFLAKQAQEGQRLSAPIDAAPGV